MWGCYGPKPKTEMKSELESRFAKLLDRNRIKYRVQEKFIDGRRLAWDFAILKRGRVVLLCEIQGGRWMARGAHNTGAAMSRDSEKACLSLAAGVPTLPITDDRFEDGLKAIKAYRALA